MRLVNANKLNFSEQHYNKSQMKAILDFVDAQPTAYDVDKVVATMDKALIELEDGTNCGTCVFKEVCDDGYDGCIQTTVAVCKSIVKAGGNIELSEHSESQGNRTGK
jgi:hypothetical protein|nr:MAG TPA: hypothetical protein [Bacteriophage sp.]